MTCKRTDIKELLPAFVSGELDRDGQALVAGHLEQCADCREERDLLMMLSEETVPDPGEAFWAELPGKVRREVRARSNERKLPDLAGLLDRLLLPRWVWTSAALGTVLLVAWFVVAPFRHTDGPALHEVYDVGYGSVHDPVLTHPSTNMTDLSDPQLETVDNWAGQELKNLAYQAESVTPNTDREIYEELAELDGREIEKLSKMLNDYSEEG